MPAFHTDTGQQPAMCSAKRSAKSVDVVVIGAGHNGLTCAAYLAAAGLDTLVVEKNDVVGGAAVTEEFHPGFRNSVAAYTVSLLNPKVIADLELAKHGLKIVERPAANFWPVDASRYLLMRGGLAERQAAIAAFSRRDAERLPAYEAALARAADVLRDLVLRTPPNAGGGLLELLKGAGIGQRLLRLDLDDKRLLLDLFTKSAADFLDGWFESDVVKGAFAFDGIVGNYAAPSTPGLRTCCSITASARSTASAARGDTRSAAWARSRRRWPRRRRRAGRASARARRSRAF